MLPCATLCVSSAAHHGIHCHSGIARGDHHCSCHGIAGIHGICGAGFFMYHSGSDVSNVPMMSFHSFSVSILTHACIAWSQRLNLAIASSLLVSIVSYEEDHVSIFISYFLRASFITSLWTWRYSFSLSPPMMILSFSSIFSYISDSSLYHSLLSHSSRCFLISSMTVLLSKNLILAPVAVFVNDCCEFGDDVSTVNVIACICLSKSFCSLKYEELISLCGISRRFDSTVALSTLVAMIAFGLLMRSLVFTQLLGFQKNDLFKL